MNVGQKKKKNPLGVAVVSGNLRIVYNSQAQPHEMLVADIKSEREGERKTGRACAARQRQVFANLPFARDGQHGWNHDSRVATPYAMRMRYLTFVWPRRRIYLFCVGIWENISQRERRLFILYYK